MVPSFLAPILTVLFEPEVGPVARITSSRVITILTGRPDFFASSSRQRLEIDDGLAAEAAADLGGDGADVALRNAGQMRRHGADHELALARAPDRGLAVGATLTRQACGSI